jgi:hypothetical protein
MVLKPMELTVDLPDGNTLSVHLQPEPQDEELVRENLRNWHNFGVDLEEVEILSAMYRNALVASLLDEDPVSARRAAYCIVSCHVLKFKLQKLPGVNLLAEG